MVDSKRLLNLLKIFHKTQKLTAFETLFVIFMSSSNTFFGSIDGFGAFWALWVIDWLEWHFYLVFDLAF
jgi:hypothetical protein